MQRWTHCFDLEKTRYMCANISDDCKRIEETSDDTNVNNPEHRPSQHVKKNTNIMQKSFFARTSVDPTNIIQRVNSPLHTTEDSELINKSFCRLIACYK